MATITASILIGKSHTYDGGIQPTHQLFLSENSRPAWKLVPHSFFFGRENGEGELSATWIPTLENMLEDALLMIALYVLRNEEVQSAAKRLSGWHYDTYFECYGVEAEKRQLLYAMCRELKQRYKIIVSVFHGSTILNQLQILSKYGMELEVCKAGYSRSFDPWAQQMARSHNEQIEGGSASA